jgi:hypothetical protein
MLRATNLLGAARGAYHALQPDPERFTDIKAMVIHSLGTQGGDLFHPWTELYGGRLGRSSERWEGNWPPEGNARARKNAGELPFAIGKYRFTYAAAKQFADWGFEGHVVATSCHMTY